jgi:aqualysin 1
VHSLQQDPKTIVQSLKDGQPWGIDRVDGKVDKKYTYKWSGKGVNVYIFDTGVMSNHDEFSGGRVTCGINLIETETCEDLKGHGTHVAGTVGGKTYGLAKSVQFINIKVLDKNGSGNVAKVLLGFDYVLQQKLAQPNVPMIINLSLGTGVSTTFNEAVNRVVDAGIFVVIAAGNEGVDACATSPASAEKGITVGGLGLLDVLPIWSNYGPCVDLYAPAVDILSATYDSNDKKKTTLRTGSSMAVPHVVGVLAMYLEWDPTLTPDDIFMYIAKNSLRDIFFSLFDFDNNLLLTSAAIQSYTPKTRAPTMVPSLAPPIPTPTGTNEETRCRTIFSSCETDDDCCLNSCSEILLLSSLFGKLCFLF